MKHSKLSLILMISFVLALAGCGNRELKKDAAKIGDVMCRNIEVMNKMKAANPLDTVNMDKLRKQAMELQNEMTSIYKEFGDKYGEKTKDPKFNKEFNTELRKAMLECQYLSKQDREMFEKEIGN